MTRYAPTLAAVLMLGAGAAAGQPAGADPNTPAGVDPGGPLVVVMSTGVDYTQPDLSARLARDGEGELIGFDFADNDRYPFSAGAEGTDIARAILKARPDARLALVRVRPADRGSLMAALGFAIQSRARVAVVTPAVDGSAIVADAMTARPDAFMQLLILPAPAGNGGPGADNQLSRHVADALAHLDQNPQSSADDLRARLGLAPLRAPATAPP